jgi:hypothetical protein
MKTSYVKGGPRNHATKEYRVPLVTGVILCITYDGKTRTEPTPLLGALYSVTSYFERLEFKVANSRLPPS